MNICCNCAKSQPTTREPDKGTTWFPAKCHYCGKTTFCCDTRDYGIYEKSDNVVEDLRNLFGMK